MSWPPPLRRYAARPEPQRPRCPPSADPVGALASPPFAIALAGNVACQPANLRPQKGNSSAAGRDGTDEDRASLTGNSRRQDFFFAQDLRAVELGDRSPPQLADLLGDPLGAS